MTSKPCTICGKPIDMPRGGSHKYCDDCRPEAYKEMQRKAAQRSYYRLRKQNACNKCGTEIPKYKSYCKKCREPHYSTQQRIGKLRQQLKLYEQMFNGQQTQIEELLEKNKELKQQLEFQRKHENKSYDKNNNLYRKRFIANSKSSD